ncbi:ABC transporter permease [Thermoclostridium caenicola]|uniref:Putative hemin transport system permease protein HrtB n=1 Tax=Thermoclostridium caenicola TaxID=659425 RepID=A0A1M6AQM4_9FIRM|nr:FtsX-like permease family protein [Thermoclostridium caenicola]SHI38800.1 putative ABC transport system permease protein [Thermoclostridium caenicola]
MKQTPLTNRRLSFYSLKLRPFRTACLILVVTILAFTLFGGSVLTASLENGMNSMIQRLGADLMVVPEGYKADMEEVLLKGDPCHFYFSPSIAQQVAQIEGVAQVTAQFFLTSLSESCCSAQVQLIGFEPETDFVIQPWIARTYGSVVENGVLIAGSDIVLESDHTLRLFNCSYPVAAQLEKTATGLDSSVFMNMDTMKSLFASAREVGINFLAADEPGGSVSSVLVKVKKGHDPETVASLIRNRIPQVDVIVSKSMITGIADNLGSLVDYIQMLAILLWAIAVLVLTAVFSVTINERKKEFAVLRILGATRKRLVSLVLTESLILSAMGGVAGTAAAGVLVLPFSAYIGERLQLPYLQPNTGVVLGILALSLLLSSAVGPLASIYAAARISRTETYLTMREGE